MPDEKTKPTSTARVNAYRKRAGGRTITVHLQEKFLEQLYGFEYLVGGQKEAIITAFMALDAILKGSKTPEADAQKIRSGELPDRLKFKNRKSCKQQPEAETDVLTPKLSDEGAARVVALLIKHDMPDLAEKLVKERAISGASRVAGTGRRTAKP